MKTMRIPKIALFIIGCTVLMSYSWQWEVFSCKNDVRDIALTGNTLWAVTDGGVVKWNLSDNSYKSFTTVDGLVSCNINQVAIDKKGQPWVTTKRPIGLFVYENRLWKQINVGGAENKNSGEFISGLEVDRFGNIWVFFRRDKHLWRYDGHIWHKHEGVYGPLALDLQKNLLAVDSLYSSDNNLPDTLRFRIVSFNGLEFIGKWRSNIHNKCLQFTLAHIALDSMGNPWISYFDNQQSDKYGVVCSDTIYTTLDGLAHDNVRSITADESGPVWCATDGGISKFTEAGFTTYVPDDSITGAVLKIRTYKILIDSNNTLYAATSKGISILKSNQWKTLKTKNEPLRNSFRDMTIDKRDAVILSGWDHIEIFNDFQWKTINFRNIRIGTFFKSNDGHLYVIGNKIRGNMAEEGLILKQGEDGSAFYKVFSCRLKKPDMFYPPAVASSGNDTCFWLTEGLDNLININKQKQTMATFSPKSLGAGANALISCILLDRDGSSVWVGFSTNNKQTGIVHFDGVSVKKRITINDGPVSDRIHAIARDSSENLWFASSNSVRVLRNNKLTKYLKDRDGKEFGDCKALFVDKLGMVWTYADSGIARFDGSAWKLFKRSEVSPDLPYAPYSNITQDKSGSVWFGTRGSGLLEFKDNRWSQLTTRDGIPSNWVLTCEVDSKNNLWIETSNGIAMRKSGGMVHCRARRDYANPVHTRIIKQNGSRFYISSKDKPEMIRYTLFDLRGRVIHRQTIHRSKSFVLPEHDLGTGLRILSITIEDTGGTQNKYLLKITIIP